MNTISELWNGRQRRARQWGFYQAFIGLSFLTILSHTFESTVTDLYGPDAATIMSSFSLGIAAVILLLSTHFIRISPESTSSSLVYQLLTLAVSPALVMFGSRAPVWVTGSIMISTLLCASAWRRPVISSKGRSPTACVVDIEQPESKKKVRSKTGSKQSNLKFLNWQRQRFCLLLVAFTYFSSILQSLSIPFIYVASCAILFVWLNASALLPPGILTASFIAFLVRLFQVVGSYNILSVSSLMFLPDKLGYIPSIVDWTFWSPTLASCTLFVSLILAREGVPWDIVERYCDDDKLWIWNWRLLLLIAVGITVHIIYYWWKILIPLIMLVG